MRARRIVAAVARHPLTPWLIPCLVALLAYYPTLSGEFVWDDRTYFTRWMRGSRNLYDLLFPPKGLSDLAYFKPVAAINSWLLFELFGMDPVGWRIASLATHLVAVLGVFALLRRLSTVPGDRAPIIGASVFACWPAGAEAVGWMSARADIQICAALAWALFFHLRARDSGKSSLPAAGLFLFAVLAKETALAFVPTVIAATWLIPPREESGPRGWRANVSLALPYLLSISLYFWMRRLVLGQRGSLTTIVAGNLDTGFLDTVLRAWGFYVREATLLGDGPPFVPAVPGGTAVLAWAVVGVLVCVLAAAPVVRALLEPGRPLREALRSGPGHAGRWTLAAVWFVMFLGPPLAVALKPLTVTPVAVRYLYTPCVAMALLALLLAERWPRAVLRLSVVACSFLVFTVHGRVLPWHSQRELWTRALVDEPQSSLAHLNFAGAVAQDGEFENVMRHLRIGAWYAEPEDARHIALLYLARYYLAEAKYFEARVALLEAAKSKSGNWETIAQARTMEATIVLFEPSLVGATRAAGQPRDLHQVALLEQAAAFDPYSSSPRLLLGIVYERLDEPVRARQWYREVEALEVSDAAARNDASRRIAALTEAIASEADPLKKLYFSAQEAEESGNAAEAARAYREALALEPDRVELLISLAAAEGKQGRVAEAIAAMERATELAPNDARVWYNLGVYRGSIKDYAGAEVALARTNELDPVWPRPYLARATALEALGRRAEAADVYRKCLQVFRGDSVTIAQVEARLAAIDRAP